MNSQDCIANSESSSIQNLSGNLFMYTLYNAHSRVKFYNFQIYNIKFMNLKFIGYENFL